MVGLPAEFAMGRRAATGTLGAYENAWATRGKAAGKAGAVLGWLPLAGSLCIAIGYAVIVTYVLKALVDSVAGTLMTADAAAWFSALLLAGRIPSSRIMIIVVAGNASDALPRRAQHRKDEPDHDAAVFPHLRRPRGARGVSAGRGGGLQASCSRRAGRCSDDPMIWIWAMGQAFFSLSVTGSGMIVYGAYLSKEEDVVGVAQHTALFDTIAAVVAALVIIPACFSYGLDVGAGPSLLFVTLPTILQDIPLGRLFAIILYVGHDLRRRQLAAEHV